MRKSDKRKELNGKKVQPLVPIKDQLQPYLITDAVGTTECKITIAYVENPPNCLSYESQSVNIII